MEIMQMKIRILIIQNKTETGLQMLHQTHTKRLFAIYMKFKFNWMPCVFFKFAKPGRTELQAREPAAIPVRSWPVGAAAGACGPRHAGGCLQLLLVNNLLPRNRDKRGPMPLLFSERLKSTRSIAHSI